MHLFLVPPPSFLPLFLWPCPSLIAHSPFPNITLTFPQTLPGFWRWTFPGQGTWGSELVKGLTRVGCGAWNSSTWEAEVGRWQVQGQLGLQGETLSQKQGTFFLPDFPLQAHTHSHTANSLPSFVVITLSQRSLHCPSSGPPRHERPVYGSVLPVCGCYVSAKLMCGLCVGMLYYAWALPIWRYLQLKAVASWRTSPRAFKLLTLSLPTARPLSLERQEELSSDLFSYLPSPTPRGFPPQMILTCPWLPSPEKLPQG
jgi:hypothetical protein